MNTLLLILLQLYTSFFGRETNRALDFLEKNNSEITSTLSEMNQEDLETAMAIVAPELSQYSTISDMLEMRSLFITYRNFGRGDFSVGYFQMKPSFIEELEREIRKDKKLGKKYKTYLITGDDKTIRETRLNRLSTLEWQLKYLKLFIDVAGIKTKGMKFKSPEDRLRYWATLYNSGFNSSPQRVEKMQKIKYFPRNKNKFNYADVSAEFYRLFQEKGTFNNK